MARAIRVDHVSGLLPQGRRARLSNIGEWDPHAASGGPKDKHDFIDETPAPPFRRIIGFDDRVLRRTEMFCSVSIWRLIAAADMTTGTADTQMQPRLAQLQAFFTPQRARYNVADSCDMLAMHCHVLLPRSIRSGVFD